MVRVFFGPFSFLLWEIFIFLFILGNFIFLFGGVYVSGPKNYFTGFLTLSLPAHIMDTNSGPLGLFFLTKLMKICIETHKLFGPLGQFVLLSEKNRSC